MSARSHSPVRVVEQPVTNFSLFSAGSNYGDGVHVEENHEPVDGGDGSRTAQTLPPPAMTHRAAAAAAAAVIERTLLRGLSGDDVLEEFLRKYPRPTPGSGVGVGPIASTTLGVDHHGRQQRDDYHKKRRALLRQRRHVLRELQEWEYQQLIVPPRRANSAAVGLYTCGLTFILFGLHYTGHFALDTVLAANAICFGGGLQFIAGLLSWVQGQTYAAISFIGFGAFFLALACAWMLPSASATRPSPVTGPSEYFMGVFYCVWAFMSAMLLLGAPALNLCLVLKALATLLSLLCLAGGLMTQDAAAVRAGGYLGIVAGAVSFYLCLAGVLNEVWDASLLPVGQSAAILDKVGRWRQQQQQQHVGDRDDGVAVGNEEEQCLVDAGNSVSVLMENGAGDAQVVADDADRVSHHSEQGGTTGAAAAVPPATSGA
ncbi:GPR1/FUN34/yaaH family [Novymonas esmeraldas]|uniref:GPR1/FUN34/yaaH family n=1 Tax=Novymonas esmeraldas TaxID=1808958 RepID=A0AAW0EM84_9TRYP